MWTRDGVHADWKVESMQMGCGVYVDGKVMSTRIGVGVCADEGWCLRR
jgi:hypothetical protein